MARLQSTHGLVDALKAEGHELPADCRDVHIVMETNGPIMLNYICYANQDVLGKLGRALDRLAKSK